MEAMRDIVAATRAYDHWLRGELPVVEADLKLKHRAMKEDPFPFLRATFYRFVPVWREACADLAAAPLVLAVGDLHVENFGTWRDAEARLVWGINDVDEAAPMPYTIDLVRLATSALLARAHLAIPPKSACRAILKGYRGGLASPGAFVLEEEAGPLRAMALSADREPDLFWAKLAGHPPAKPPTAVRKLLAGHLPTPVKDLRFVRRVSGLGSLGRPRHTALAFHCGRNVARDAKATVPSAYDWAMRQLYPGWKFSKNGGAALLAAAVRCIDPFHGFQDGWQIRRLAPHCARIELAMLPARRDEELLLFAMGRELANLHMASRSAIAAVKRDLAKRPKGWLFDAATRMAEATRADWKDWKRRG